MAGSLAWYNYTADNGNVYGVQLDTNLGGLEGAGFTPYTPALGKTTLPKGMTMRYINAVQTSGTGAGFRSRSFPIGIATSGFMTGAENSFTYGGVSYIVSSVRGEKARSPNSTDTGLTGASNVVGGSE